ncbi:MAG: TIGR01777 family oxidoreductase [Actinomycetota bacterium]
MRVLVSGSSGLIGGAVVRSLEADGHQVTRLVRGLPGPGQAAWDIKEGTVDAAALEGHDAVVHLAGAGIGDHRWTGKYKREVLDSRVQGTSLLARTLAGLDARPRVLVSGSAVGYYGDRGDEPLTEQCGPGRGFLADVVRRWEEATAPAEDAGTRVVHVRSGIVQAGWGGALRRLMLPFKLGFGGRWGSGKQWLSWVHIDDEVAAIRRAIDDDGLSGPLNATSPNPATVRDYTAALGRALHRPAVVPTPTFALNALLGTEMVAEMLLGGQRVLPAKLEAAGFEFGHPDLDEALADVVAASKSPQDRR